MTQFDPDYLRELFRLEGDAAFWRERPRWHFRTDRDWRAWNAAFAGKKAGASGDGRITVDGKRYDPRRDRDRNLVGQQAARRDRWHARRAWQAAPHARPGMCKIGVPLKTLIVLAHGNDPFSIGTLNDHRNGRWLAERLGGTLVVIHLRGLHYLIVAKGNVRKPRPNDERGAGGDSLDGPWTDEIYVNSEADWQWLLENASKAARWLGCVPFDRNGPVPDRKRTLRKRIHHVDDTGTNSTALLVFVRNQPFRGR